MKMGLHGMCRDLEGKCGRTLQVERFLENGLRCPHRRGRHVIRGHYRACRRWRCLIRASNTDHEMHRDQSGQMSARQHEQSVPHNLPERGVEVKLNFSARPLLRRIHHTRIKRTRIHVQAHRPLIELSGVEHAVHRIGRIHSARLRHIHLHRVERLEPATPASEILVNQMKVLHQQPPDGNSHPAILITMVVHGTRLSNLPADRHQFVERSSVNQIASVMLPVPGQIRSKRRLADRSLLQESPHRLRRVERGFRQLPQPFNQLLNGNRFRRQ